MTTKKLSSLAVAIAAFAMACADPATAPSGVQMLSGVTRAIIEDNDGTPPLPVLAGRVQVCKLANATGTFGFSWSYDGGAPVHVDIVVTSANVPACVTLPFSSPTSLAGGQEAVVVTEDADQTNWALTNIDVTQYLFAGIYNATDTQGDGEGGYSNAQLADTESEATRTATMYINSDMSRSVTFTNTFTPPTGCTYTKGWYRNNGSSTVIAVDGRTIAQAQAIFNATPGKPGNVTFGGNNTLLNLYQQLLAALNNLGGDANEDDGPAAVDAAIDAAQNGTGGTGLNITTTLSQTEMSSLIDTLSAFNEGTFTGWPHCDDN